jgi:NAD dependent epimerase/dehydratase family enzyme
MYSLKCSNYKKFIINGMGKIVLIGGSGFIGRSLLPLLNDFEVVNIKGRDVNSLNLEELAFVFNEAEVIINLSGQSIVGYWTKTYKKKLYDSRVVLTKKNW